MLVILSSLLLYSVSAQPIPIITNPRARFVPELDIIYVEWQIAQSVPDVMFTVRHSANQASWNYVKTSDANVRIPISSYRDGEQVHVQTRVEKAGQVIEDWTQDIVVAIKKKNSETPHHGSHHSHQALQQPQHPQHPQQNPAEMAPLALTLSGPSAPQSQPQLPNHLLHSSKNTNPGTATNKQLPPPIHFTANIMGPTTVQLKWRPPMPERTDIFYLVNVKQLTTSTGSTLQNQQIKTAATSFTIGKMIAGEKYEMTIRSASSQESASSTASFVEITMPKENDYFEIGNLIISSHFRTPAHGIVNLTWDVPPTMNQKIASYNVEYSEMGSGYWQKIQFHGSSSSATLHHLKSNTEYLLRIKTVLVNNIITESGQFRFRTPRVEVNPIHKVDVIFSHDVNSVKLQWMLEKHVNLEKVAGYDVYLSQNKDSPDSQWKLVRLDKKESSLSFDNLESSTMYFVRVNVRNTDGSIIRAPSIYRFKTIDWSNTSNDRQSPFD